MLGAQNLIDIRLGMQQGLTRVIIETDQEVNYKIFNLSGPPRMIIDFTNLKVPPGFGPRHQNQGLVRGIRYGQFNAQITRIVLDLTESSQLAEAFSLTPQGGAAYRLVLDLTAGISAPEGLVLAESKTDPSAAHTQGQASGPACQNCDGIILPLARPAEIAPQKYIIVIDPGHGGQDPGAIASSGLREADLVLDMAIEIANELRQSQRYEVYLTRADDRKIDLSERAELARGRAADFFLSIHANANPDSKFRGFMVFTLSDSASDSYAQEVAARENRAELGPIADIRDMDIGSILGDILFRDTLNQSIDFATRLIQELSEQVHLTNSPHRRAGFVVLKSVRMPSALLEIGHLSNRSEANALQNRSHRRKIAVAVRKALDAHFTNN